MTPVADVDCVGGEPSWTLTESISVERRDVCSSSSTVNSAIEKATFPLFLKAAFVRC